MSEGSHGLSGTNRVRMPLDHCSIQQEDTAPELLLALIDAYCRCHTTHLSVTQMLRS
jgi:hypothetical protein